MPPQENPCRVLLGLHGNSNEGFFLKKLHCLECRLFAVCDLKKPSLAIGKMRCCSFVPTSRMLGQHSVNVLVLSYFVL